MNRFVMWQCGCVGVACLAMAATVQTGGWRWTGAVLGGANLVMAWANWRVAEAAR